jgi:hypothetical protein
MTEGCVDVVDEMCAVCDDGTLVQMYRRPVFIYKHSPVYFSKHNLSPIWTPVIIAEVKETTAPLNVD